jgi:hypothetical protein
MLIGALDLEAFGVMRQGGAKGFALIACGA